MPKAKNGAVELYYETFGDPAGEPVLLINGLGSQLTRWPAPFCQLLVDKGLHDLPPGLYQTFADTIWRAVELARSRAPAAA